MNRGESKDRNTLTRVVNRAADSLGSAGVWVYDGKNAGGRNQLLVATIEFLEWASNSPLRHPKFIAPRRQESPRT